jgi:integrase
LSLRDPLTKPSGTDTYCYSDQEVSAILARCAADPDLHWLERVLKGLVFTGLRIGELVQLRWAAVHLEAKMIRILDTSQSAATTQARVTTKTGVSRQLPIHPQLQVVFERMERASDGRVFHGPRGGVLKPDVARTVLLRDVLTPLSREFPSVDGKPTLKHGRLHSFRHYFCSKCAENGINQPTVMLWLGHRDSDMVRHYFHLKDETSHRLITKLNINPLPPAE